MNKGVNTPTEPTNTPYIPSEVEAKHYLHGLYSKPRFIARSSTDIWTKLTGLEVYLEPKELSPLSPHHLSEVWEVTVSLAMVDYLLRNEVQFTILNPLRIGVASKPSPPTFIMIGINHDTLSSQTGIEVAVNCRSILLQNQIGDVHVLVCKYKYQRSAMMYKPAIRTDPATILHEPFSTTLGIPICNAKTSNFEGTGGLHQLYQTPASSTSSQRGTFSSILTRTHYTNSVRAVSIICLSRMKIKQINRELEATDKLEDEDDVIAEQEEAEKVITAFKELLTTVTTDWEDKENCIIGHVTLSPPLTFNYGKDGFMDDWAMIEMYPSMISKLNFIGNAIDLGYVGYYELMAWMYPHPANPSSFKYPCDRLLQFFGTVSNQEMFRLDPKTGDHNNDPVIMVLKNGNASNLTVSQLNTICAFTCEPIKGKPGVVSKEVTVLLRNSKSGPFSEPGDSGSVNARKTHQANRSTNLLLLVFSKSGSLKVWLVEGYAFFDLSR
ncbi:hypothetical protein E1B28_013655 [Marasmius oreades]|uniref:Uncharacterized protein n=1 Tax=Marasmius oreades TaxID=181124 RepID=A0A9P7UN05_9AGAR|nr:uncharacterized protein E1B28_013655 [Marasmius oreades]KAG7087708.1 hypothetical protein E1B28_013655 [Marasmius oreades]